MKAVVSLTLGGGVTGGVLVGQVWAGRTPRVVVVAGLAVVWLVGVGVKGAMMSLP